MTEGFIKVHRSIIDHPVFKGPAERWAFVELLALASWKPTTVRYKDRLIKLERGQTAVSIRDFARRVEWEQTKVLRFFEKLKNHNMIRREVATGVGVITVCNYCKYQDDTRQDATPTATPTATGPQQRCNTEQEREEVKEPKKDLYPPDSLSDDPPKTNVHPIPKRSNGTKAGFADFWQAYPRREGKIAAEKAFEKAVKVASAADIMAGVSRAAVYWERTERERQFIPLPATWLNQGRWCDEFEPPGPSGGPSDAELQRTLKEMGF